MTENKKVFCMTCGGLADYDPKFEKYRINDRGTNACSKHCSDVYRFFKKIKKDLLGCWEWTGAKRGRGYGAFKVNGKIVYAHRYSFELHWGKLGHRSLVVRHTCDNRLCCNPNHLIMGTAKENTQDAIHRGRHITTLDKKMPMAA